MNLSVTVCTKHRTLPDFCFQPIGRIIPQCRRVFILFKRISVVKIKNNGFFFLAYLATEKPFIPIHQFTVISRFSSPGPFYKLSPFWTFCIAPRIPYFATRFTSCLQTILLSAVLVKFGEFLLFLARCAKFHIASVVKWAEDVCPWG